MDFLKSASKLGGFIILAICSIYAFMLLAKETVNIDYSFKSLLLGVGAFILLIVPKTAFAVAEKYITLKSKQQ